MSADAALSAFWESYFTDRERGTPRTLAEYLAAFPGYEREIAAEYAALSSAPPSDAAPRCGRFRLEALVGRGGQGEVWRAYDPDLRRHVAVKRLSSSAFEAPEALARFRREAEVAARLDLPGICGVYETGADDGRAWIAMRFVHGTSLADLLARRAAEGASGAARLAEAAPFVERVLRTLHAAHAAGVVHRDLKPGNLMVGTDGAPTILDFGVAADAEAAATLTRTGDLLGTPAFMAPEQFDRSLGAPGPRSDVYAAGVVLFEWLAGRRRYDGATREETLRLALEGAPCDLRPFNPAVSRDLATVVAVATARDPAARYPTAAAFADDLAAAVAGRPIAARAPSLWARGRDFARRRPYRAAAALVAALVVPLGAAWAVERATSQALRPAAEEAARARAVAQRDEALSRAFLDHFLGRMEAGEATFAAYAAADPADTEAVFGLAMIDEVRARDVGAGLARIAAAPPAVRDAPAARRYAAEARALAASSRPAGARPRSLELVAARVEAARAEPVDAFDAFFAAFRLATLNAESFDLGDEGRAVMGRAATTARRAAALSPRPRLLFACLAARTAAIARDVGAARDAAGALRAHWPRSSLALGEAAGATKLFDREAAALLAEEACALDPTNAHARFVAAENAWARGRVDEAEAAYRAVLALRSDAAGALHGVGRCRERRGDLGAAIDAYREALRVRPDFLGAAAQLAEALAQAGRVEDGLREIRAMESARDDYAAYWIARSRYEVRFAEPEDALRSAERAAAMKPRAADVAACLADAQAAMEEPETAERTLEDALASGDDRHPGLLGRLAALRRDRGDVGGARVALLRAREAAATRPSLQPPDLQRLARLAAELEP